MDSSFSLTNVVAAAISFLALLGTIFFMFLDRKSRSNQENKTTISSSPPPSSLSLPQNRKHHVFPSFHGPDVRRTLLSHILVMFRSKGIDPFIDNNIERSKSIGPELIEAIRGSRISIVFLSKNYASSTWCLDELVEIIKCRKELDQTVMVIFHEVDPTDVKKQTGDFGKVFNKTCKGKTKDDTGRWKHALAEVAKIAGYHSKSWDNEAKMIEKIATDVSNKLNNSTPSSDFNSLVGMESHMINMGQLLQLDSKEVSIIGIMGPPGIGKTTIARFLFDRHFKKFPLSGIMDIREFCEKSTTAGSDDYNVKLSLQEQFLSRLTNEKDIKIPHLGIIEDRLKDKKVLVVLDDVVQLVQLEAMAKETCWFGPGSRIIVTTQNGKLLKQIGINLIYKVDLPSPDEALQMFCMYAFGQIYPKDGFMELACEVTRLVGALPLALRVMGSYLKGMSIQYWKEAQKKLMTRLDGDIESILKLSYDALDGDGKHLFLHIACIFNDEWVDIVKGYLANSSSLSNVAHGLSVLVERSLVTMDSGRIRMHSLLVLLGKEIVRKESGDDPGKSQFLWDARDIYDVLSDDQAGSRSVIGIDLKEDIICTNERAFERLSNLQFLRIDHHGININPRSMNYISRKLRLLSWRYFRMSCFPSSFHPKFLVKLDMESSDLEKLWEDTQPLSNLKWMNLKYSRSLKELPDLSTATNLCELNLHDCSSLVCLPSIGNAINLHELDLSNCSSLVKLHSSIGNAINLKRLELSNCSKLEEIPSSIGKAINLKSLIFYNCSSLVEIPSIMNAINLDYVDLNNCSKLVKLPSSLGNEYKNLRVLGLNGCSSLLELPNSIGNAVNLEELVLVGCSSLVELPQSIGNAINLYVLDLIGCSSLVELPNSIKNAVNLEDLNLRGCSSLKELPSSIGNAINLRTLNLNGCSSLKELPSSIGNAVNLEYLNLKGCSSLKELPSSIGNAFKLRTLDLTSCLSLVELPSSIINLRKLKMLKLKECSKLEVLLTNIDLERFEELNLSGCSLLRSYSETSTNIENLKPSGTAIKELDPLVGRISKLRRLVLSRMKMVTLPQLPDSVVELVAENCEYLEILDCSFRNPDRLNFGNCFKLNQEARDLIIQTRTNQYAVLPGGEVPVCFTYRSSGGSLTVNLNEKPPRISTKFKACIILADEDDQYRDYGEYESGAYESGGYESGEYERGGYESGGYESDEDELENEELGGAVCCSITSKQNALTACISKVKPLATFFSKHLYIFEVEAVQVTSTELVFEFEIRSWYDEKTREIKECGIYQLSDRSRRWRRKSVHTTEAKQCDVGKRKRNEAGNESAGR